MSQQLAVSTLYQWFKDNVAIFNAKKAQIEFRDSGQGSGYVRVDTGLYMSELLVKDKGTHLTVERIDMDTDESVFPHTGECESQAEFEEHLAQFVEWFQTEHN